ncbi:uncharacterized protein LOC143460228 [Clavelina lepadiformis]|uniref:uncharacterized protein LOC143460228 n=1 Tax=Clavelina lepadiformis TaxID=159417 RepID=UPI0040427561
MNLFNVLFIKRIISLIWCTTEVIATTDLTTTAAGYNETTPGHNVTKTSDTFKIVMITVCVLALMTVISVKLYATFCPIHRRRRLSNIINNMFVEFNFHNYFFFSRI